jgi:hypothetical protein
MTTQAGENVGVTANEQEKSLSQYHGDLCDKKKKLRNNRQLKRNAFSTVRYIMGK